MGSWVPPFRIVYRTHSVQGRVRSSNLLVLDQTSEKGNSPSRKCPKEVKRMARGHFPEKMAELKV